MYVLIAYDVSAQRTEKFRRILSKYLLHEQNSVFAGELVASKLKILRSELSAVAAVDDRLMEVVVENRHNMAVSILRKEGSNGALVVEDHGHHLRDAEVL